MIEKKKKLICAEYLGSKAIDGTEINQKCNSAEALVDEEGMVELGDLKCEFQGKGEGQYPFFKYRPEDRKWRLAHGILKNQTKLDQEILKTFAKKLSVPDLMILADQLSQKANAVVEFIVGKKE